MNTPPSIESRLERALRPQYELRGLVGAGGMGRVYEAWDAKHRRPVAVKVALRASPELQEDAFRREIELVAALRHPGIVPLLDSGEVDGFPYFIMPLAEAATLADRLREGPLDRREALRALEDVAGALDHAHTRGIVHRDIKPGNILLEGGRAVVSDFGIARSLDKTSKDDEAAVGTPRYMAPEQILDPKSVGPPADIYALGCVAYECLTGERPFDAARGPGVVGRKVSGAEGVGAGLRLLPQGMREALLPALDPDPEARPASAGALVSRLQGAAEGRYRRLSRWAVAASVVMAGVLGWMLVRGPAPVPLDADRIVVGPIVNETGDPDFDALASSVVDYLTRGLMRSEAVGVIPTETALAAARHVAGNHDSSDPIREIAVETGAMLVASGAVFREAGGIGLRLLVTDAERGEILSAPDPIVTASLDQESYVALLGQAGERLAGWLELAFDERMIAFGDPTRPPELGAYRTFSKALDTYLSGDYERAAGEFMQAYDADTTFATALLYAAVASSNLRQYATEDSLLTLALAHPERLTRFEGDWIEYRRALLSGNRPAALRAVRAAASRAPGSKAVYNLGVEAVENRRLREAVEVLRRLPPDRGPVRGSWRHLGLIAVSLHLLGDHEASADAARQTQELFPDLLLPRAWALGTAVAQGRLSQVRSELAVIESLPADAIGWTPGEVLLHVGQEMQAHGHEEEAWAVTASAASLLEDAGGSVRVMLAMGNAYAGVDRWEEALRTADALLGGEARGWGRLDALALAGQAAVALGDSVRARNSLEEILATDESFLFGAQYWAAAIVATSLGEAELALDLLRRAAGNGFPYGLSYHLHPGLAPLRDHSGFRALTAPIE